MGTKRDVFGPSSDASATCGPVARYPVGVLALQPLQFHDFPPNGGQVAIFEGDAECPPVGLAEGKKAFVGVWPVSQDQQGQGAKAINLSRSW